MTFYQMTDKEVTFNNITYGAVKARGDGSCLLNAFFYSALFYWVNDKINLDNDLLKRLLEHAQSDRALKHSLDNKHIPHNTCEKNKRFLELQDWLNNVDESSPELAKNFKAFVIEHSKKVDGLASIIETFAPHGLRKMVLDYIKDDVIQNQHAKNYPDLCDDGYINPNENTINPSFENLYKPETNLSADILYALGKQFSGNTGTFDEHQNLQPRYESPKKTPVIVCEHASGHFDVLLNKKDYNDAKHKLTQVDDINDVDRNPENELQRLVNAYLDYLFKLKLSEEFLIPETEALFEQSEKLAKNNFSNNQYTLFRETINNKEKTFSGKDIHEYSLTP